MRDVRRWEPDDRVSTHEDCQDDYYKFHIDHVVGGLNWMRDVQNNIGGRARKPEGT